MNRSTLLAMVLASGTVCGLVEEASARTVGKSGLVAARPVEQGAITSLPVREVTVFKDGHAFLLHEGTLPTDEHGDVVIDHLPAPVLGTFWPYASDRSAELRAVRAGSERVLVERTALTQRELIEANVGARVYVTETSGQRYIATIGRLLARSAEEQVATNPPNAADPITVRSDLVIMQTPEGERPVRFDQIREITFAEPISDTVRIEETRNLLTLDLDWGQAEPAGEANVGMTYLQKGLRWIPNYRITLDGNGKAVIELQATLINELVDLDDVTMHLVVGVPTFAFDHTVDPIALQQAAAQLSQYFQQAQQTQYAFSNALMSQSARMGEYNMPVQQDEGGEAGPEVGGMGKNEDLFIFSVDHVTLERGERMVMPIMTFELEYTDVYTLDLPLTPPPDVSYAFNFQQQSDVARLLARPKVMHEIRLKNTSDVPITTAPALILKDGRLIAQGMTTYTAIGGTGDLELTASVDIELSKDEKESSRIYDAQTLNGYNYARVELAGRICLTNHHDEDVVVEVRRNVLGNVDSASHDGEVSRVSLFGDESFLVGAYQPTWWHWWSWPSWWGHFNGIGKIEWTVTIPPDEIVDLEYQWHYYWR